MRSTGAAAQGVGRKGAEMVVDSKTLADELRRRRLGRPALLHSLKTSTRSTWLPGELAQVPSGLLVLAAVSMVGPARP